MRMQNLCFYTWHAEEGPLFKGLPTVEKHRFEHSLIAAQDLQLTGISDIIISDTLLSHIYANNYLICGYIDTLFYT